MKKVLDHGFVELVDHMPLENLDKAIVDGARVSYQTGTKTTRGDRGLIRYLVRNWHTSPLELVVFTNDNACITVSARSSFFLDF